MASIVVCLLARNCEMHLENVFRQLDGLSEQFSEVRILFIENNSTDRTRERIKAYAAGHRNTLADCFDDASLDELHRIEKMVRLRNRALELVREACETEPDVLLMADADVDFRTGNLSKIIRNAPPDWVSLSANGRYYFSSVGFRLPVLYYDLFAYVPANSRTVMFSENEMLNNRFELHRALRKWRYVPCRSAFGGMTVYRYAAIKDNMYTLEKNTETDDFEYLCEHIPFSLRLAASGRSYICREMKVLYEPVTPVVYRMLLRRRLTQRYIQKQAKKILRQRKREAQRAEK